MEYKIKSIYSIQSLGSETTVWCSNPQSLIIESAEREDISSDGYVSESFEDEELFKRKIVKKIGIYLDEELIRICDSRDEANEVLKKFQDFENKLNDMQVNSEIPLVDDSLFKFTNDDDYDSDED